MSRRPFDGFEVHLVAEFHDPGGDSNYCETVDSLEELEGATDESVGLFYTVYGHRGWLSKPDEHGYQEDLPDGGAEAIADFPKYRDAIDLAYALADGKPVTDMVIDTTIGLE